MSCISGDLGTLRLFIVDTDHNEQVHEKVAGVRREHGEIMVCAVTYTSQALFQSVTLVTSPHECFLRTVHGCALHAFLTSVVNLV